MPKNKNSQNDGDRHAEMLETLKLFRVIFASAKRQYETIKQATGLAGAQAWTLAEIREKPGTTVGELAKKMAVHRASASELVARLAEKQLVSTCPDGRDKRRVRLELTAKGSELCSMVSIPTAGSSLQEALMNVPAPTLRALRRHLTMLLNAMEHADPRAQLTPIVSFFRDDEP